MATLDSKQWRILSPYLDHALSLSEEERTRWLLSLAESNPGLAAQLRGLLDEHRAAERERFLNTLPASLSPAPNLAGQTIGSYRLISPLGQGGMGSVWLVQRNDGRFERRCALKFLNAALVGRSGEERFKREGTILGKLSHPNIAQLVDAGISPSGQPYLVLEYVEGEHIDLYCDQRELDVEARIGLFLEVLLAVSHAHANLIVHRDLKSSNVIVREDGRVKLLDFGIAKLLADQAGPAEATVLTLEGGRALTPLFAAPEQLTGTTITTATDVYALGVLLCVLLTGQHPSGSLPQSPVELVKAIVETESLHLSNLVMSAESQATAQKRGTTPEKLRRLLRGDLDTIVSKALKKNPQERYSSVTAFADDLRRFLRHETISARPDTIAYRASKFVRRNWGAVALTTLAVLATLAGLVGTMTQARTARRERDFAFRQLDRAASINDFNEFILSDISASGKPFTTKELLDRAEHTLERQEGASANRVELMASLGTQYTALEETEEGRRVLEQAYKLSRGVAEPAVRAKASCYLAATVVRLGEPERAESLFQEGLRELPEEPQFALARVECLREGSLVAQARGDGQQGIARMETAQRLLQNSPFNSDWMEVQVLMELGEAYRMSGQNYKASSVFEKVNASLSSMGRDETGFAGVLYNNWALALERLGRPLEAEQLFRRAMNLQGEGPVMLNNYALILRTLGRLNEAADYSERAYQQAQQTGDKYALYRSIGLRAVIYLDRGDFTRASAMLSDMEPALRQQFPPDHMAFGQLASAQAVLACGRGDLNQALLLADQGVAILEHWIRSKGQGSDMLPTLLLRKATVELAAKKPVEAEVDAARALAQLQTAVQPRAFSSYIGTAYLKLAIALQAEGKNGEARSAFRSAAEHLGKTLGPDHPDTRSALQMLAQVTPSQ
jgi:serine/threonine-protein kinase